MSVFSNLSVRIKILSITLLTLTGFLIYLGISYYAKSNIEGHLATIQMNDMPAIQRINSNTLDLVNLRESYAAAITDRDDLMLSQAEEAAEDIERNLAEQLSSAPEAIAAQQKMLSSFRAYKQYANSLAKAMVGGTVSNEEGPEKLRELARLQQGFDAELMATKKIVYQSFSDKMQRVRDNNQHVWAIGMGMGVLLAVIALGLSLLITRRSILGPLNFAVEAANKIAEGDWAISIQTTARDELGMMLQSIQKMRDRLKSRFDEDKRAERIKTTVAELGSRMRGDLALEQLSEQILNYLVPALHGQVGLLYIPQDDELVMTGSYAFTFRKSISNRIKPGEGLVGQAALERKQIVLAKVPDDYIVVSSGLGEVAPRHIVVTPILHDGELRGILEIGSLNEIGGVELEILQLSVEHIAVAINSALSRRQLSVMLQQTQEQAELLQKQQDDMRAINADLEAQAIALSASELRLQEQQDELKRANEELEEQTQALRASEESLQAQQEELRVINEELEAQARLLADQRNELIEKNDALKASQQVLEDKTRALEASSKYKSEFLSTMSHELRTPLNSILILSNSLAENKQGNLTDKQKEHARVIHSAGSDLLSLINDILDIAKVEEGKMQLVIDTLDVTDLAEHFRRSFEHVAQHRGLELHVNVAPDTPPALHTDRQRLEQVLRNFFSNALKFTHQGSVSLNISRAPDDIKFNKIKAGVGPVIAFAVKDTGIGVPKDKQELIFEAFQQADGTTSRKYGGTGLGLTISREFSHLLGGEVHLHSDGEGTGSTFTLYLPIGAPEAATEAGAAPVPGDVPVSLSFEPAAPRPSGEPKSLIIIEDDEDFADVLAELAAEYGFKPVVAHDGERGIEMVKQTRPDAVILDIGLPGIDGWEVLETLKNDPRTKDIPVHCFSGRDESSKAMTLGAFAYYKKPATLDQIKEAFGRIEAHSSTGVRRLLVVEDNSVQNTAIHALFEENQVDVTICTTGEEALDYLKKEPFDCLILDLSLPDIDGYTLLEMIHEDDAYPKVPVIVYTARDLTREQESRLRKYADRIILKTDQSSDRLLSEASLFLHWVDSKDPKQSKPAESANHRDDLFQGKKVLLVDDDMRNIYALSASLEEWGCEIEIANNGQESLDALEGHPDVDIVLMDIMMPEMDGYEAMKRIRAQERFKKLPMLALTAKAMRDDRAKCIEAGANDYISKPVDTEKLQSLMRVWLDQ
ncbi:MAG: sensor histidine kinase/respose regulator [Moraxellaceae bacterium]|jgi:CheY-like chemotaxis protein/HAMP domain-containing protein|nr:sensor histidine kinase/respose regulator [Moraxellaceae bacterium]